MSTRFAVGAVGVGERRPPMVRVGLDGRFMLPSRREHGCQIVEMSTREMLIASAATPPLGDQVIVYIADLGRFEGVVARYESEGFVVGMALSALKYEKLAEQLDGLAIRGGAPDQLDSRRHQRFVPLTRLTTVRLANGRERMARINDISATGVNVEFNLAAARLTILVGSRIFVGAKAATVIRLFDGGFVAQFDDAFAEGAVDETTAL